jgi:hypothetical protein
MSNRRNPDAKVGFVNFPREIHPSTGEGGCFVRLVVLDPTLTSLDKFIPCCGGYNGFFYDETFLGDDVLDRTYPSDDEPDKVYFEKLNERSKRHAKCEKRYFPREGDMKYYSEEFLAVLTIGATGWSSSDWVCKFEDLTLEGKELYSSLEKLYPGCEIRLLTFLDT